MNKQKILVWLMSAIGITLLITLVALTYYTIESQYTKYVKEWEDSPAQQTLQIDALYFPNDGITACAATFCHNSRFITVGDSNTLNLTKRPLKNKLDWLFLRLNIKNEIYEIEIELGMDSVGSVAAMRLGN